MELTRDMFLKVAPVQVTKVLVPELGGEVFVKGMTAKGRSAFEKQFQTIAGKSNKRKLQEIRERLVVACLCDGQGHLLLTDADIDVVGDHPAGAIERIVTAAQVACGMTDVDVESMVGNSDEITTDS